jgi:trk system potassium uptake protein TrkA
MRVIVIGAGEVGYQLTKSVMAEGSDVVVVDKDPLKLQRISEDLDVATITADGSNPVGLEEAGASGADILLAVTDSDETNMITCMLAKAIFPTIKRKIARIRNQDYYRNEKLLSSENLDINPAICPEIEVAEAVIRLLETPFAADVEDFEDGLVKVIGFNVPDDSKLNGVAFKNLPDLNPPKNFLIGIIERDGNVIVPTGSDRIRQGDVIYMPVLKWEVGDSIRFLGTSGRPAKKIMIVGGGKVGYHVASVMEKRADVRIIDPDTERCKFLSKSLKKSIVLNGDGSDESMLIEENIEDMDAFVSVSNNDELNIMSSLLAKRLGSAKTITIVNKPDYISLAGGLGLQSVLSPRHITANSIMKYVRRGEIISLTMIAEGKAEVLEARIGPGSALVGRALVNARLPKATLVGTIAREGRLIIPTGEDVIKENDKLIFFTLRESIKKLEKLLV